MVTWDECRVYVRIWNHSGGSAQKLVVLIDVVLVVAVVCVYRDME